MREELEKALDSLTRYLAARDHSELELRTKLKRRYSAEIIDAAIEYARERNWLPQPEVLAQKAAEQFGRRKKSHGYIKAQLRRKGLPPIQADPEAECEKIRELLKGKFGSHVNLSYEERAKAYRFLKYRGFEDAAVRKVLNEKQTD